MRNWSAVRFDHCVITGASSGLGAEFARQLAPRARRLTLVARRIERLQQLASALEANGNVRCEVVALDLAAADGAARLLSTLTAGDRPPVDLLVNNAGFGRHGAFRDDPWPVQRQMLQLNLVTPTELIHGLWDQLCAAPGRGVINVCSTAGFQPIPWFATYAASKSFLKNWTTAVGEEARVRGVRLLALCPGPIPTEFHAVADARWPIAKWDLPAARVVQAALRGYDAGRRQVIPGGGNRVLAWVAQVMPLRLVVPIAARVARRPAGESETR